MPNILRQIAVGALMCALMVAGVQPATAAQSNRKPNKVQAVSKAQTQNKQDALCKQANKLRKQVIKKVTKEKGKKKGKRAPGRNICLYGMEGGKKPTHGDKVDYKQTLDRIVHPPPPPVVQASAPASGAPASAPASPVATGSSLSAIAQCESGGDPTAVSENGLYRGKWQFDLPTWRSVGGTGDPAAAPEAEQDARAQQLYAQRGSAPWPVCGQ
jgi:hypothetical protein